MPSSSEIRQQFLDFFCQKHGHTFVPSSPVVPLDDPTLLFANAGMNQFKPYFLGTEKPPYKRVANTQKCIRAGGKHNDLDDVGKDTYHHTFFEMLGNWSFGDYFKKDAIAWAWELLTQVWKLDPARLHVTVFEGDPANGIPRDDEAAGFWKAVGVPDSHIHLGNKKDNFWEMGDTGPCGPCTEIHYDATPDKSGAGLVNAGSDKVVEIWNNVFIQFNRNADKSLTPLPAQHVDTGMGFERITKVLQGKESNYDTDIFTPILDALGTLTGKQYGGKLDDPTDTGFRVIADHLRMSTFAIVDGARPGNKKRDAVLRSVIRRAVRYGYMYFDRREPFLFALVPTLVEQMGGAFPELRERGPAAAEIIRAEEKDFLRTIARGLTLFDKVVSSAKAFSMGVPGAWSPGTREAMLPHLQATWEKHEKGGLRAFEIDPPVEGSRDDHARMVLGHSLDFLSRTGVRIGPEGMIRWYEDTKRIPGEAVFVLYTTYGFPPDLSQQMAIEQGKDVDLERYKDLLEEHERISRGDDQGQVVSAMKGVLPKTDDSQKYGPGIIEATVLGWVKDNTVVTSGSLTAGDEAALLLDRTNFYAEQGGQVGDTGEIVNAGLVFEVEDTQRLGDAVLHVGRVVKGSVAAGAKVHADRGSARRADTVRNHTATHLLNLALREVLGPHVEQKGSLVDADKTRFDFSHDKPLTTAEVRAIEEKVNQQIVADLQVTPTTMPLAEAKKLPGVRAVFGEKYPDPVRVVLIGAEKPEDAAGGMSVEFCGGTHMPRTGGIGYFKVIEQGGVAKGIRRVTAVTGRAAAAALAKVTATVDDLTARFQCKPEELPARVDALQEELKKVKAQLAKGAAADLGGAVDKLLADAPEVNGSRLVVGRLTGATVEQLRAQVERVKAKAKSALVVFASADDDGKVPLVAALTDDLVKRGLKAGDLLKPVAEVVGGKGGGKPDLAQAGGKDAAKIGEALAKAVELGRTALEKS